MKTYRLRCIGAFVRFTVFPAFSVAIIVQRSSVLVALGPFGIEVGAW